jgi:hypothetical protein
MAHLVISGDRVRLNLSILEVLGAVHGSPEIALDEIESVEVVANPWARGILKGVRIGTGVPLIALLGTMKYFGGKDFCIVYKRRPNAIVTLKNGTFKRWIFEIKDMSEIDTLKKAIA